MKLTQLLKAREALLRQTALANQAFAYQTLDAFAARIARAGLAGRVTLKPADPDADRYWATLTAHESSQSVIEEHFTEEDLTDIADAVAYATGRPEFEMTFELEDFADRFLASLRHALEQSGIVVDTAPPPAPRASDPHDGSRQTRSS